MGTPGDRLVLGYIIKKAVDEPGFCSLAVKPTWMYWGGTSKIYNTFSAIHLQEEWNQFKAGKCGSGISISEFREEDTLLQT